MLAFLLGFFAHQRDLIQGQTIRPGQLGRGRESGSLAAEMTSNPQAPPRVPPRVALHRPLSELHTRGTAAPSLLPPRTPQSAAPPA